MFFLAEGDARLYVVVYVDDILLTGNSSTRVIYIISQLNTHFFLKTLGSITYFLGFETSRGQDGLHLSQTKYSLDLLKRTQMLEAKPYPTPMIQSNKLHLRDNPPFEDITQYKSVIGALQYLTLSRPDIAFLVNTLSQFLQPPTQNH
uniref:Reverse transcriptase Ty1/copia-type domain-containing protein n=1 Tax=Cannabis sativa TaxID=3483 RepID=A0A803P8U2_CANSA